MSEVWMGATARVREMSLKDLGVVSEKIANREWAVSSNAKNVELIMSVWAIVACVRQCVVTWYVEVYI